jgi:hypothetical protein
VKLCGDLVVAFAVVGQAIDRRLDFLARPGALWRRRR